MVDGDIDSITLRSILPHRYEMMMIDGVTNIVGDSDGVGHYISHKKSFWVKGHFPNNPVVPAYVIIECMAQTSGAVYLNYHTKLIGKSVYLVGINGALFKKEVHVGDEIEFKVHKKKRIKNIVVYECFAFVCNEIIAKATLLLGVKDEL